MTFARFAVFDFDDAVRQSARSDNQLIRQTDQIHGRKFNARTFVAIVEQHFDARFLQLRVQFFARLVRFVFSSC